MIGTEDQPAWWCVGPAPFGDLGQHVFDGSDATVLIGDRDRLAGCWIDEAVAIEFR